MIYDCFTYFDELDLLELRLLETAPAVGRWVVVEGTHTHQGRPKTSNLRDHYPRLRPWWERIVHATVPPRGRSPFERERAQREDVISVLRQLAPQPDDVIAFSDLDEITRPIALASYRPGDGARYFEHANCYYWLNCRSGDWGGAKVCSWADLGAHFAYDLHALRHSSMPPIQEAGWHFSFTGGVDAIIRKLGAYLHEELDRPEYNDERHLRICRATGIDLFVRSGIRYSFVRPEGFLPEPARQAQFRHLWADAYFHEVWSGPDHILRLCRTYDRVRALDGLVVEIGPWEGYSTVALAQATWPDRVVAVDTWIGNVDESPTHETVIKARGRDVMARFLLNVEELTRGNVDLVRANSREFLAGLPHDARIKFAYVDASHDYLSVRHDILGVMARLVPGGVICGDDFLSAGASREDLSGGVERAVRECCPGFERDGDLWVWQNSHDPCAIGD